MDLFNVYSLFDVEPEKAKGAWLWDTEGTKYLDFYGGHAVISIGHQHPLFIDRLKKQVGHICFYSNSVKNPMQKELADKLGKISGYEKHSLFLCNSGAEANENALKLASFFTGRKKVMAFKNGFHGRTSGTLAVTDNKRIISPFNQVHDVCFFDIGNIHAIEKELKKQDTCAAIIEGLQGIGGIYEISTGFFRKLSELCSENNTILIIDEIQSGYGRTGNFFAHQFSGINPDIITTAKGMGNGFPVGGVLIHPKFNPEKGMLGTTFGGNHLACAAGIAVLDAIKKENLISNAGITGDYLKERLSGAPYLKEFRGRGLMIGLEFEFPVKQLRADLLYEKNIFTGISGEHTLRILPPLIISQEESDIFIHSLTELLTNKNYKT